MKMFSIAIVFGLLTMSAAYAQSNQPVQATIPFPFTVQKTSLSAGSYQLTYSPTSHLLTIRGLDPNWGSVFASARPGGTAGGPAKLVFHCYDKNCHLAQIAQGETLGGAGLQVERSAGAHKVSFLTREVPLTIPKN